MISQEHGEYLLNIAKKAVKTYLETGEQILVPEDCPEELKEKLGVFVTLNKNNQLRGCIGYPEPILLPNLSLRIESFCKIRSPSTA